MSLRRQRIQTIPRPLPAHLNDGSLARDIFNFRCAGFTIRDIARIVIKTPAEVKRILRHIDATNPRAITDAGDIIKVRLRDLASVAANRTIEKGDATIAVAILKECGVFDEIRPKAERPTDNRIVIEWSGPPPDWVPAGICRQVDGPPPAQLISGDVDVD